ncbi:MAG: hypothetical protein C4297_12655 [Gemmataceae bacterium]
MACPHTYRRLVHRTAWRTTDRLALIVRSAAPLPTTIRLCQGPIRGPHRTGGLNALSALAIRFENRAVSALDMGAGQKRTTHAIMVQPGERLQMAKRQPLLKDTLASNDLAAKPVCALQTATI